MSLDDLHPTQYFGPDPATFTGPHGKPISVSQDHARRLIAAGAVDEDQFSNLDTGHRDGCSFGRTARCNCTYLAQWDRTPEYTAPTFKQEN